MNNDWTFFQLQRHILVTEHYPVNTIIDIWEEQLYGSVCKSLNDALYVTEPRILTMKIGLNTQDIHISVCSEVQIWKMDH